MGSLLAELKRRKVFRVAAVYAVVAWLLIQVADVVLPTFGAPAWVNQTLIFLFMIGFPLALILAWAYEVTPEGVRADSGLELPASQPAANQGLLYATFTLVLLVAGFQIADRFFVSGSAVPRSPVSEVPAARPGSARSSLQLAISLPDEESMSDRGDFDLSPDGERFVYRGPGDGDSMLWLRRLDQLSGQPLPGTQGANRPRFSPDGNWVVFQAGGEVMVVDLRSGFAQSVFSDYRTDTPDWSHDGNWIYFHSTEDLGIYRIPASGGEPEQIVLPNRDAGESRLVFPEPLPGGNLLYQVANEEAGDFAIQSFDNTTGQKKNLIRGTFPRYSSSGYLFYQDRQERRLMVGRFDSETLTFTGPTRPVAERLLQVGSGAAANLGVSDSGRLLYRQGDSAAYLTTPVWVDRRGLVTEIDPNWRNETIQGRGIPAQSPTGDRLAIALWYGGASDGPAYRGSDVWIYEPGARQYRLSFDKRYTAAPRWAANGEAVVYASVLDGVFRIWRQNANGSGDAELILETTTPLNAMDMSTQSDWLVYASAPEGTTIQAARRLQAIRLNDRDTQITLLDSDFNVGSPALSKDDSWLAYTSNESGLEEVYVRPFPDSGSGRWQISAGGGSEPVWSNRGNELYYRDSNNQLVAVPYQADDGVFTWSQGEILFSTEGFHRGLGTTSYSLSPDDQRFLFLRELGTLNNQLILVDNWMQAFGLEAGDEPAGDSEP